MSGVPSYDSNNVHDNYAFFDDRAAKHKDMFAIDAKTAEAIAAGGGLSDDGLPDTQAETAGAFVARFAEENGSQFYHGEGVETVIYEEAFSRFGPKYPELDLSGFANVVDIYGNGEGIDAMGIAHAMTDGVLEIDLSRNNHGGLVDIHLDKVPPRAFLANISLQMEGRMPASVEDFVDLMSSLSGDTLVGEPEDAAVALLKDNFGPDLDRGEMKAVFDENFIAIDYRSADLPIVNLIWSDRGQVTFDDTPGELIEQEFSLEEGDRVYSHIDFVQAGDVIDEQGNVIDAWEEGEPAETDAANVMAFYADDLVNDGAGILDTAVVTNDTVSVEEWDVVVDLYGSGTNFSLTEAELTLAISEGVVEVNADGEIINIDLAKVSDATLVEGIRGEFGFSPGSDELVTIHQILPALSRVTGDASIETTENVEFLNNNFYGDDGTLSIEELGEIFSSGVITIDETSSNLDFVKLNFSEDAI